jgi:hypothetical protein
MFAKLQAYWRELTATNDRRESKSVVAVRRWVARFANQCGTPHPFLDSRHMCGREEGHEGVHRAVWSTSRSIGCTEWEKD